MRAMPQTIFNPDSRSEDAARAEAQGMHHWEQYMTFMRACFITSKASEEKKMDNHLSWQRPFSTVWIEKSCDDLTAEDCAQFCFKDCALYAVSAGFYSSFWQLSIFEKIYRRWYPTRAEDVDISHGAFFCKLIRYTLNGKASAPPTIEKVLKVHKDLCSRVDKVIPDLLEPPRFKYFGFPTPQSPEIHLHLPPAEYKLRPTFKHCFIYIHVESSDHSADGRKMKEQGVRVVFLSEKDAARHGCTEDGQQGIKRLREEEQGLDGAAVIWCDSVERAMKVVLSTDPQRLEGREEYHECYRDMLDSRPDTTPVDLCLCEPCLAAEKNVQLDSS